MARPLRIQYPGAVYHVMARGDGGEAIFLDERDRVVFLGRLGEACKRTGWRVHAYVLMGNHYHLLLETPEANLVAGMKWLQGTYTQRFNYRHKRRGHVLQGRYKAIPVDSSQAHYFQVVSTYIHLNPVRAGLVIAGQQKLKRYKWSSYPGYLNRAGKRPEWLSVERVLGSVGLKPEEARGYEAYLEGRALELARPQGGRDFEAEWRALRRGWYVGEESFFKKLQRYIAKSLSGRRRESFSGEARSRHDEAQAEELLSRGLKALGVQAGDLAGLGKGASEKVVLAWWLRTHTTVSLRWVSERLEMGHFSSVAHAVRRMGVKPGRQLETLRRRLEEDFAKGTSNV